MAITEWDSFVQQCLLNRVLPTDFVAQVQAKLHHKSKPVFKALLDARGAFCLSTDPLPPRYIEQLLTTGAAELSDLLIVLVLRFNHFRSRKEPVNNVDILSLQEISTLLMSSKLSPSTSEAKTCLLLSSKWLTAVVNLVNDAVTESSTSLAESLSSFLSTLAATSTGIEVLSMKKDEGRNTEIIDSVAHAVGSALGLFPTLSVQTTDRLGAVQKHISMFSDTSQAEMDVEALQFQASVVETSMVGSREGTMAYLEAMLSQSRTIDDTIVFNFLAGRHSNDFEAMFQDAIMASFDLMKSKTDTPVARHYEIFIRNKLPAILSLITASSFGSFSAEQILTKLWPQLSESWTARRFLHVCSLNQILTSEVAKQLIANEELLTSLPESLLTKDELVTQVASNQSRTVRMVEELLNADGSAPAITQALVEVIMAYCAGKETHHLKDLANAMLRKPESIDALAMFIRPTYWLSPIGTLLDQWRWDDIHGESQPFYDEFGRILLLVMVSKHRLKLSIFDMGINGGFVAQYFDQEGVSKVVSDLSEETKKHLGDWINALYVAEGLSDELTSSCSPQEFYLLVPTLLQQSVNAQRRGRLTDDALKGGLEYLLEPFLLPSLVSAISWTRNVDQTLQSQLMPIFNKTPSSEADIHRTILNIMQPSKLSLDLTTLDLQSGFSSIQLATRVKGPEYVIDRLTSGLKLPIDTKALDVAATVICCADRMLRDMLRLKYATVASVLKKDRVRAEAIVHLHRRVEAYATVLIVQDIDMQFAPLQLNSDEANLEVQPTQEGQAMDDIDQVLDEQAALGNIETDAGLGLDTDMSMDDLYGLPSDDMGLTNLDDLDLEMF